MKFCIINAHSEEYEPLARLTTYGNRTEYCDRHGYDLKVMAGGFKMKSMHPLTWDRLKFMRDILAGHEYDWVYCCGADTMHTNFNIRLEDLVDDKFHVIIAPDWCAPVQADSFLVRNSESGIGWLDFIISGYKKYKSHGWVENQAMIDSLEDFKNIIKIVPQRIMNAREYDPSEGAWGGNFEKGLDFYGNDGKWKPGDFIIHWPNRNLEQRLELAQKYLPLVIK